MSTRAVGALLMVAGASLVLGPAAPAFGGGSFMRFSQDAYAVGQEVEGRMVFEPQVTGGGRLSDGPWFAFMQPESSPSLEPSAVRDQAFRVDRLQMKPKGDGRYIARVGFVLPEVDHGRYELVFCNDPCVHLLRGYAFAFLRVTDATEAYVLEATNGLARSEDLIKLRTKVKQEVSALREDVQRLEARLATFESRSDDASNGSANLFSDGDIWLIAAPLGLAIVAVVLLLWRRRGAASWIRLRDS